MIVLFRLFFCFELFLRDTLPSFFLRRWYRFSRAAFASVIASLAALGSGGRGGGEGEGGGGEGEGGGGGEGVSTGAISISVSRFTK